MKLPVKVEFEVLTAEKLAAIEREANEAAEKAAEEAMAAARAQFAGKSEDEIAEIYRTGGKVPPTGRKITAEMRLPKGLIIQSKWPHHNNWAVVKVLQELPDGKVEVVSIETGSQGEKARSTLLLAPDFVEQPFVSEAELAAFRRQLAEQTTSVSQHDGIPHLAGCQREVLGRSEVPTDGRGQCDTSPQGQ